MPRKNRRRNNRLEMLIGSLRTKPTAPPATEWDRSRSYDEYLQSEHWHRTRQRILRRDSHRCRLCNAPGHKVVLNVHHRTYKDLGHEDENDLVTLCRKCHQTFHNTGKLWQD